MKRCAPLLLSGFTPKKFFPLLDTTVSGSPILQNGKLVGAVTHVLISDPTRGYGITISSMLNAAECAETMAIAA